MSFLQQVQKVSDAHYVLPKVGDMRTEVQAYLSGTLFAQINECGHIYKDLEDVLRVLESEGIARMANRLYPIANINGTD